MNIIILGAGQVGSSLVNILSAENHDIAIVDLDAIRLSGLQEHYDVRTVMGHCTYPDILRQAGADDCDMIIAVTDRDEVNMVACQVAYSLFHIPKKIARIRSSHYFIRQELFGQDNLPIDVFISPENLTVEYVEELIRYPSALQVLKFAGDEVKVVAVKPYYGGPLLGKPASSLCEFLPDTEARIVAIFRNDRLIPIESGTNVELGDEVFFICKATNVTMAMSAFRCMEDPYNKIIIAGGGNIGSLLAKKLSGNYQVKLIDQDSDHCKHLAENLDNVMVLCGDACDKNLLINENIEKVDVFCAVTDDDEDNILSCLQAKRLGAKQVMALFNRAAYVDLIQGVQINVAISPQQATVGSILKHVRKGDVVNVYSLRRGAVEVIEVVVHGDYKSSKVVGRHLHQIKLPKDTSIVAVVRQKDLILPNDEVVIEDEDHVVLFVGDKKYLQHVEKLFFHEPHT